MVIGVDEMMVCQRWKVGSQIDVNLECNHEMASTRSRKGDRIKEKTGTNGHSTLVKWHRVVVVVVVGSEGTVFVDGTCSHRCREMAR